MKFYNGGVTLEYLLNAPLIVTNSLIDYHNDCIREQNQHQQKQQAQKIIEDMKRGK